MHVSLRYRGKITIIVNGKKYEFKANSPTKEFWSDLKEELFMPTGADLQPLYRLIGYDQLGNRGGDTTNISLTTSATSTSMKITISAGITWESTSPLYRIVVNCRHRTTGYEYPYFDATLPSPVQASPGATITVTYDVEIYIANVSNSGALSGYTLNMYPLFSHFLDKLTGKSNLKRYIYRALLRNQTGSQQTTIPLELDVGTGRAYKYNYASPSRVDPVYFVDIQGISSGGFVSTLFSYTAQDVTSAFSIMENQPVNIEIRITTPA